jgi:hypothetical protein
MFAPFDALQVDALFEHLPQRTHIAQFIYRLTNTLYCEINFFVGGETTQAKTQ